MELGLEMINPRATSESWTLDRSSNYRTPVAEELRMQVETAHRLAQQQSSTARILLPLDTDRDGRADWWAFYVGGKPAFLETDRFGTGCHDLRVDLRKEPWEITEFNGWAREPPVPLAAGSAPRIPPSDLYDWVAVSSLSDASRSGWSQHHRRLFPNLEASLRERASTAETALAEQLDSLATQGLSLLSPFAAMHRQQGLRDKLDEGDRISLTYQPYDLDRRPGKELAVAFLPWGVHSIRFYQHDWIEDAAPLAEVFFVEQTPRQIELAGRQYFRVAGYWLRVAAHARRKIASECLGPGYQAFRQQQFYAAIDRWEQGLALAGLLGDLQSDERATLTQRVSEHVGERWNFDVDGLNAYQVLTIADGIARRHHTPDFYTVAETLRLRSQFEPALECYRVALTFANKERAAVLQANCLDGLAAIYRRLGNYDRAVETLFSSLDVEASLAYAVGISQNLEHLVTEDNPDSGYRAMRMRSHALTLNRACKLATIASLYLELGELEKAHSYLEEAERLNQQMDNLFVTADLLAVRARLNAREDRWDLAEQRLLRALELIDAAVRQQTQDDFGRQRLQQGYALHEFRVSFPHGFDLVEMKSAAPPSALKASFAGMLSESHLVRAGQVAAQADHHFDQAARWEAQARRWFEEAGDTDGITTSRLRQAAIAVGDKRPVEAAPLLAGVLAEARERHLFEVLWRALLLQAAVHDACGDLAGAIASLEQAADEIESLRSRLHSETVRQGFFGSKANVYEQLARSYLAQRDTAGAAAVEADRKIWQCMERAKARTLLDLIGGEQLQVRGDEVVEAVHTSAKFGHALGGWSAPVDMDAREGGYRAFLDAVTDNAQLQEVVSLTSVQPTRLEDVQRILAPGELLIEYLQTEGALLAAVLTREGVRVQSLEGLSRQQVTADVETFRQILQDPATSPEAAGRQLYAKLLAPCLKGRRGVTRICVVPAGALHYLPFAALILPNNEFLAERVQVYYAASASALVYAHHRHEQRSAAEGPALVVANPQPHADFDALPFAAAEGAEVARVAPASKLLAAADATESAVAALLPESRVFHFAGHTHLPPNSPMRAALMCTENVEDDGRLEVRELFEMDLSNCDMAVLSACETRLGRLSRGDEIVGLERAFLRAGVPTVVASLWKVDDAATQRLMAEFYRNLFERKLDKLEALRQAQLAMLRGGLEAEVALASRALGPAQPLPESTAHGPTPRSVRHPRYWAGFVLSGDWR